MARYYYKRRNPKEWVESLPGAPNDTFVYHGGPSFSAERSKLHRKILAMILRGCTRTSPPQAIVMMGGPASGKSSALRIIGDTTGFITLDSDAIKGELPEYQRGVAGSAKNAAASVHAESSFLVQKALRFAIGKKCNLIYDGTGSNASQYATMIDNLHRAGYSVRLVYVHVEPALALPRALARAEESGRYVPEYVIKAAYDSIPFNFSYLADRVDAWTMFDTSEFPPRFVGSKEANQTPVIRRPDLLDEFLAKFPQKTPLKLRNPRRAERTAVPLDAKRIEQALAAWVRSGKDDGETGL